ncbi:MAG: aminodeoxychorismate synthase component I [Candidatus Omnitrophica bacterium]|jgi:para-aminobenzoate synthetase/4-amino-4-deoxychorismate lyase|nr:aminodeoxychorismate synthase component I [Candidatus Omnitrophota bacterium]
MRKIPLIGFLKDACRQENFVFFDTGRFDKDNRRSYLFEKPIDIISCYDSKLLRLSIDKIEKMLKNGYYAAGFLSYEAGLALEPSLWRNRVYDFPLLWFGVFKKPVIYDGKKARFSDEGFAGQGLGLSDIKADTAKKEYIRSIADIKRRIEEGLTYQVNRTFKLKSRFKGSVPKLYAGLRQKQKVSYAAFIKFGKGHILSFSPELFFRLNNGLITVRPMKGTMPRGRSLKEDTRNARLLYGCPKNRSENIMIVDLLRNDLGRISREGSVRARDIFEIEKYETLFQMTSTVKARIRPEISLYEFFAAVFPSGSVTGAPKIRTMRIIDEIESSERGIYTGGIGFLTPDNSGIFNVAIRTMFLNKATGKAEMGIGSGIVYDSDGDNEYEECILKASFLTERPAGFSLIETMLWRPARGFTLLGLHLKRLSESARYFDFIYERRAIVKYLKDISSSFDRTKDYRVRLLLAKDGRPRADYSIIREDNAPKQVIISAIKTRSSDKWLFHKTTNRNVYESEYNKHKKLGYYDVLFLNEKGQVTEGAISNVFIEKNNTYYTPPLECGVLNGVYRRFLIAKSGLDIKEKVMYPEDLLKADNIYLTNAVRGMAKVCLNVKPKGVCDRLRQTDKECACV